MIDAEQERALSVSEPAQVPKIELYVHLEGTVRPQTLLDIARRNGEALPFSTVEEAAPFYEFRDFAHFIEVWVLTTNVLRTYDDFRQVVVDYAREVAAYGAVYLEGIVSPFERLSLGLDPDELFSGYCDGAQQAREELGIEVGTEVRERPSPNDGKPLRWLPCPTIATLNAAGLGSRTSYASAWAGARLRQWSSPPSSS